MRYEYSIKRQTMMTDVDLNRWGAEGWELCAVAFSGRGSVLYDYYFKRQLQ